MQQDHLHDLYVRQLHGLFATEMQIVQALPKMTSAASNVGLRLAFESHLTQSRMQAERVAKLIRANGYEPDENYPAPAIRGLIAEGEELIGTLANRAIRDAALIGAAQRIEHYEIAGYGTAAAYADLLGQVDAAYLLRLTMEEETKTDETLTELALRDVLKEAYHAEVHGMTAGLNGMQYAEAGEPPPGPSNPNNLRSNVGETDARPADPAYAAPGDEAERGARIS